MLWPLSRISVPFDSSCVQRCLPPAERQATPGNGREQRRCVPRVLPSPGTARLRRCVRCSKRRIALVRSQRPGPAIGSGGAAKLAWQVWQQNYLEF
jgi:hypothetical protein